MPILESTLATKPANSRVPFTAQQRLLSISPNPEDHVALRHIVKDLNWQVDSVRTVADASTRLISERFAVILCEKVLADGTWKDLLQQTGESPLIVTSRLADEYLWSEVLNLGGYDVFVKPFSRREVVHVLTTIALHVAVQDTRTRFAGAA